MSPQAATTRAASPKATKSGVGSVKTRSAASPEREELVRVMAYAFYEARGRVDGHDLDDWLHAQAHVDQTADAGGH